MRKSFRKTCKECNKTYTTYYYEDEPNGLAPVSICPKHLKQYLMKFYPRSPMLKHLDLFGVA